MNHTPACQCRQCHENRQHPAEPKLSYVGYSTQWNVIQVAAISFDGYDWQVYYNTYHKFTGRLQGDMKSMSYDAWEKYSKRWHDEKYRRENGIRD